MAKVKELMTDEFFHALNSDTVDQVLHVMTQRRINSVPVLDDQGELNGILVRSDIYRFMIDPGHYISCPIEWVMTKNVVSTDPEESLGEAGRKLLDNHIEAMPIIDHGKVVGMISGDDLLRYYTKRDKTDRDR